MDSALINVLIGIAIGAGVTGLVATIISQSKRIKLLEEANRKNIPYTTLQEIWNAKAVLNSELFQSMCKIDLIQNCGNHLDMAVDHKKVEAK